MKWSRALAVLLAALLLYSGIAQARKCADLAYLEQHGEFGDWEIFSYPLGNTTRVPRWMPGVWPTSLALNRIPDPARYATAARVLPRLDMLMVFVYEPMPLEIFTALGAVPDVRVLDLTSTCLDDAAFREFRQFHSVVELYIDHSSITDACIPHLSKFQKVRELSVNVCALTDASLMPIVRLPELATVSLDEGEGGFSTPAVESARAWARKYRPGSLRIDE